MSVTITAFPSLVNTILDDRKFVSASSSTVQPAFSASIAPIPSPMDHAAQSTAHRLQSNYVRHRSIFHHELQHYQQLWSVSFPFVPLIQSDALSRLAQSVYYRIFLIGWFSVIFSCLFVLWLPQFANVYVLILITTVSVGAIIITFSLFDRTVFHCLLHSFDFIYVVFHIVLFVVFSAYSLSAHFGWILAMEAGVSIFCVCICAACMDASLPGNTTFQHFSL